MKCVYMFCIGCFCQSCRHIYILLDSLVIFFVPPGVVCIINPFSTLPCYSSNDICHDRKRQTISRADVTAALRELDMESFIEPLDAYFEAVKNNAGKITSSSADVEIEADVDRDVGVDEEEEQEENEDPDEPVAKSRRLNEDGDVPVVGDGSYGLNQQEKE